MFTLGLALLTWSTIYGLENFDVWDGSELSCIAVANIAAGKVKCLLCRWRRWSHQMSDVWHLPVVIAHMLMYEGNYPRQMSLKSWDGEFVGFKSWRNVMCWCYWLCCHGQCHHPPSPLCAVSVSAPGTSNSLEQSGLKCQAFMRNAK